MTNFSSTIHDSIIFSFFSPEDLLAVSKLIAEANLHPVAKIHVLYESNLSARKVISCNCNLKLDTTLGTRYCLVCIQRFIRMTNNKTYFSTESFKIGPLAKKDGELRISFLLHDVPAGFAPTNDKYFMRKKLRCKSK